MHAFDPRKRPSVKQPKRRLNKKPLFAIFAISIIGAGYLLLKTQISNAPSHEKQTNQAVQTIEAPKKTGILKIFTGEEFRNLYESFAYPNTALINEDTPITGDIDADDRIRKIAVERGYKLRSAPVTNAFIDVGDGFLLQQRAAQPWLDLKAAAKKDGINLGLTAAYRSAEGQKEIFTSRLSQLGIPVYNIAYGGYDSQISQVLRMTAIPGYSRHHTGYTVDIACEDQPTTSFAFTDCFEWLSADNYKNTKTFGWIPGYPEGAGQMGPDPESWEYVWVGTDPLTE